MNRLLRLVFFIVCAAWSAASCAGEFTLGAMFGSSSADGFNGECSRNLEARLPGGFINIDICTSDDSDNALGLNIGYMFTDSLGLEAGYADLGEYNVNVQGAVFRGPNRAPFDFDINVDTEATYLAAVGSTPVTENLSLTVRLGVYEGEVSASGEGTTVNHDTDIEFYGGASLDYRITDRLKAQLRYDDLGIEAVSLGLQLSFGN